MYVFLYIHTYTVMLDNLVVVDTYMKYEKCEGKFILDSFGAGLSGPIHSIPFPASKHIWSRFWCSQLLRWRVPAAA